MLNLQVSLMTHALLLIASDLQRPLLHKSACKMRTSEQVYATNEGSVERASDATRRGRMIKCKMCGEKGATLGCHKRSCRASFHLSCARDQGCLLKVRYPSAPDPLWLSKQPGSALPCGRPTNHKYSAFKMVSQQVHVCFSITMPVAGDPRGKQEPACSVLGSMSCSSTVWHIEGQSDPSKLVHLCVTYADCTRAWVMRPIW